MYWYIITNYKYFRNNWKWGDGGSTHCGGCADTGNDRVLARVGTWSFYLLQSNKHHNIQAKSQNEFGQLSGCRSDDWFQPIGFTNVRSAQTHGVLRHSELQWTQRRRKKVPGAWLTMFSPLKHRWLWCENKIFSADRAFMKLDTGDTGHAYCRFLNATEWTKR